MSAGKRPASNSFGSSQIVVKRQKSIADLGKDRVVAVTNGNSSNGALIQAVSESPSGSRTISSLCAEQCYQRRPTDGVVSLGATHKWTPSSYNGAHW